MDGNVRIIDPSVKDELLRFPTVELIRLLFPDVRMRGRSVMCNPLRGEQHPSLSCFRSYDGYPRWKDHATGEVGDNIDFFRLANPDLGYVEAVDTMARLVLGKTALGESSIGSSPVFTHKSGPRRHVRAESQGALRVTGVCGYDPQASPADLVSYVRSRGISDEVASKYLSIVTYVNTNKKGRTVIDPCSGLPVFDDNGELERSEGLCRSLGMPNDIQGFSLRSADTPTAKGFKGTNASFLTTISDGGAYGAWDRSVRVCGAEAPLLRYFSYDISTKSLYVSEGVCFSPVRPEALGIVIPFLDEWSGRYLEGRELRCALSVIGAVNRSTGRKVVVVEGMFDALSHIELERLAGRGPVPGCDLIVLNSLSNLRWAVPILSSYGEVCSVLDNDLRSGAGQNAFVAMRESIAGFSARSGRAVSVTSLSGGLAPYKDLNEYLMYRKGFSVERPHEAANNAVTAPGKTLKKVEVKHSNSI